MNVENREIKSGDERKILMCRKKRKKKEIVQKYEYEKVDGAWSTERDVNFTSEVRLVAILLPLSVAPKKKQKGFKRDLNERTDSFQITPLLSESAYTQSLTK